ncbi:MAG: hydrogenase maturation protease [Candidatus Hydrogenedentota bacterium]|nr:MAG: hydrogenase maturation protease [Candidatus Hydrogenedentota bacterium]
MPKTLVIGYGNPLRGDDAVGQVVAQRFAASYADASTEVRALFQLLPELAEDLSTADTVVFVDASATLAPGEVRCESLEIAPSNSSESFTHRVTPHGLLQMSRKLYGKAPRAWLISVGGEVFGHAEGLSPQVAATVDEICGQIRTLLANE